MTNGPLVNLPIFNSSNKNKAGDINSLWNLLVQKGNKTNFGRVADAESMSVPLYP